MHAAGSGKEKRPAACAGGPLIREKGCVGMDESDQSARRVARGSDSSWAITIKNMNRSYTASDPFLNWARSVQTPLIGLIGGGRDHTDRFALHLAVAVNHIA